MAQWLLRAAMLAAMAPVLGACTNTVLSSAHTSMAAGNYAQAHQELEAALQNPSLSARDRREAKDDLCTLEVQMGPPAYSLAHQRQTCADAVREPGSSSGERLAKLDAAIGAQYEAEFKRALSAGNIGSAVAAVRGYERVMPNDRQTIARMDQRLWVTVDRQDQGLGRGKKRHIHQALAALGEDYPGLHSMNQHAFKRWIGKDTSPAGVPMLSAIAITGHTLVLKVPDDNLKQSAIGPQTFARINDAFSVWCQCDGATHVASEPGGLPVYLARLNPSMERSEVLVLPWR
ncbi:MAG TPA: hypothetical protein VKB84_22055 [Candidatus Binataceae bacterium]|nr:hypothetical protein [Candidatus Binataceae bacterium]